MPRKENAANLLMWIKNTKCKRIKVKIMSVRTGENEQGLKKIMDLTRGAAIVILLLHFYYQGYSFFHALGWSGKLSDRLLLNISRTGLFQPFHKAKLIALAAITLSLLGTKGKKNEKATSKSAITHIITGVLIYFGSYLVTRMPATIDIVVITYVGLTITGLLLFIHGGAIIARLIKSKLDNSVFNDDNETFPQEERLLENPYSIHFQTRYKLKDQTRAGQINIVNPFRGTLLIGNPGSGKTRWIVKPMIEQMIRKQYAMVIYDFKYPDLTNVAYAAYMRYRTMYKTEPEFLELNFDNPVSQCNPLMPGTLKDISDASEASRTLLLALNQDWITKSGDFWVESAINFFAAVIWYMKKFENGKYCTIPHCIELLQTDYDKLFSVLRIEPSIEPLIKPFINAFYNAPKMLEGMMASLTISLGKLSSENIYYVLSGNDFSLDIANPQKPKILCLAGNPQKATIYGAVFSLYLTAIKRTALEQQQQPLAMILEEFSSIYFSSIDRFLAICRSYLIAVSLVIQDLSQLNLYYGKDQAAVIMNITGNIIAGQTTGETADQLAKRFGKIKQDKESLTVNSADTSINKSRQLDFAIPASTIGSLSSGEFCGIVADNPDQKIKLKKFHGLILPVQRVESIDLKAIASKSSISGEMKTKRYLELKKEAKQIVLMQLTKMLNTPSLAALIVTKNKLGSTT